MYSCTIGFTGRQRAAWGGSARIWCLAVLALTLSPCGWGTAMAAGVAGPLSRPATLSPLAPHAVSEAVTRAGSARIVAVGERGIVLLSDDEGAHWRQVPVPVSVTLTSVHFVDAKLGWAAGHGGVILHTVDGGEHWMVQLDGTNVARFAVKEAQAENERSARASTPPSLSASAKAGADVDDAAQLPGTSAHRSPDQVVLANAQRLVKEGADKPFLSLWFTDANHGTAVGAYGIAVHTDDGGKTWQSWTARVGNLRSLNLYAVTQRDETIWIAGEQGFVARSTDSGNTFAAVRTPYRGSFFSLDVGADQTILLGGLRGNVLRSANGGASFEMVSLESAASVSHIVFTGQRTWLLADQAGQVFASQDGAVSFTQLTTGPAFPLNGIAATGQGTVIGAGYGGVMPVAVLGASTVNRAVANSAAVKDGASIPGVKP